MREMRLAKRIKNGRNCKRLHLSQTITFNLRHVNPVKGDAETELQRTERIRTAKSARES
jgi:hypothetical protein